MLQINQIIYKWTHLSTPSEYR